MHTGLAVITGTEDRQHAYVALTRGTDTNMAYVFTVSPKLADPVPGPRPAPELARYDRITAERTGGPAPAAAADPAGDGTGCARRRAGTRRPAALRHPDPAASPGRRRPPGDPARDLDRRDRPGPRAALPGAAHEHPAARLPAAAQPPGQMAVADPARRRTGRPGRQRRSWPPPSPNGTWPEPATSPASSTPGSGTALGPLIPLPAGPWSAQVPDIADPERRAFAAEIAAMMDARKERIGEHAAEHALPWAVNALGPVPGHPLDRLDWQRRASSIGAYRELSGYDHPADPIGPEPAAAAPDNRAAWYEAFAALGPADGPDVRGMPDGTLLHLRDTYPIETAWAPPWVGDELRQVRAGAQDARLAAIRADAEAKAAANRGQRDRPPGTRCWRPATRPCTTLTGERETVFAAVMADRADWDAATRQQRHLAVAADAELRRRHPDQHFTPLRSAEPQPATEAQRDELTLTAGQQIPQMGQWINDLAAGRRAFADTLAERQSLKVPSEDPTTATWARRSRPGPARPGRDLAAAQARDPAFCADTRTRRGLATPTRRPRIDSCPVHAGTGR